MATVFKIMPGSGSFTDAAGNVYTISATGDAIENGNPLPDGGGTGAMELADGVVYGQDGSSKKWYTWNQTTWTAAATAPPDPTQPPPSPPPTDAVLITPGNGSFKDAAGNVYTLSATGDATENGKPLPDGGGTSAMELANGIVYGQDGSSKNWYTWNQTTWTAATAPPSVTQPPPPQPPPPPPPTIAQVIKPGLGIFTDSAGNVYSITKTGDATENGGPLPDGGGTSQMALVNGKVYAQDGTTKKWYTWNQTTWTASSAPVIPAPPDPHLYGAWSATIALPTVPVAEALLPTGKVVTWSSNDVLTFEGDIGTTPSNTLFTVFDPRTLGTGPLLDTGLRSDLFCPGVSYLPDGRILVAGGASSSESSIYDPKTGTNGTWSAGAALNIARGYNGSVTLSTGDVFTIGSSWSGNVGPKEGELWSANTGWKLTGIDGYSILQKNDPVDVAQGYITDGDDHPWLFAMPNGRVFDAGPATQMNFFDPYNGTVTPAGQRGDDPYSMTGICVMYAPGKILKAGGAPVYTNGKTPQTYAATNHAVVIDITKDYTDPTAAPVVTDISPLNHARAFANAVVLPDGEVFIAGGQSQPLEFSDSNAVLTPEMFNPVTMKFIDLAPMAVPRDYHSTALLLPDGRVEIGGGGDCGGCTNDVGVDDPTANHPDYNVYSPSYLFNADGSLATRPVISAAPTTMTLGNTFDVTTTGPSIAAFDLVRLGSVTHGLDTDQRRIPLTQVDHGNGTHTLTAPSDPGIAIPGFYMLFALTANNTPSIAAIVQVQPAATTLSAFGSDTMTPTTQLMLSNNPEGGGMF